MFQGTFNGNTSLNTIEEEQEDFGELSTLINRRDARIG